MNLLLGFSSGIPLALTAGTLQAWMTQAGVSIKTIGIFSLVGLPSTVKFLWAPLLDRYSLPFLGKRRGWLLVFQLVLLASILLLGQSDPKEHLDRMAFLALCVSFFSSSQDIVVDAFRTEILTPKEQGPGVATYVTGYRLAMLVSGAVAMTLSDRIPWPTVYMIMACTMFVGLIATLIADEPEVKSAPPASLNEAFTRPMIDYFSRKGAAEIAIFIVLYKMGDTLAAALSTPFLVSQGYSNTEIGLLNKFLGTAATIVGATAGGALMVRWGMRKSLFVFGILQALSNFVYVFLTSIPPTSWALATAIGMENICGGLGTAAFTAFLMRLCSKGEAAGQYAVLTSFMAVARVMLGPAAGSMAESWGWQAFFIVTVFAALPGTFMLVRFPKWMAAEKEAGVFEVRAEDRIHPSTIYAFIGFLVLFFSIPMFAGQTTVPLAVMASLAAVMTTVAILEGSKGKISMKTGALSALNVAIIAVGYWKYTT